MLPYCYRLTIVKTMVGLRQWRNESAKCTKKLNIAMHLLFCKTCSVIEMPALLWSRKPSIRNKNAAQQILITGHEQLHTEKLTQPASTADVIRVQVGH